MRKKRGIVYGILFLFLIVNFSGVFAAGEDCTPATETKNWIEVPPTGGSTTYGSAYQNCNEAFGIHDFWKSEITGVEGICVYRCDTAGGTIWDGNPNAGGEDMSTWEETYCDLGINAIADGEWTSYRSYKCNDGIDNDADGLIDYPNDPGCSSSNDDYETGSVEVCGNLVDEDCSGADLACPPEPTTPELRWTDASGNTISSASQGSIVYLRGGPTGSILPYFSIYEDDLWPLADDSLETPFAGSISGTEYYTSWTVPNGIIGNDEEFTYELYFEVYSGYSSGTLSVTPTVINPVPTISIPGSADPGQTITVTFTDPDFLVHGESTIYRNNIPIGSLSASGTGTIFKSYTIPLTSNGGDIIYFEDDGGIRSGNLIVNTIPTISIPGSADPGQTITVTFTDPDFLDHGEAIIYRNNIPIGSLSASGTGTIFKSYLIPLTSNGGDVIFLEDERGIRSGNLIVNEIVVVPTISIPGSAAPGGTITVTVTNPEEIDGGEIDPYLRGAFDDEPILMGSSTGTFSTLLLLPTIGVNEGDTYDFRGTYNGGISLTSNTLIFITETCTDGIQNGLETDIDCGGGVCPDCETCTDGIQNQDENGIDCEGVCSILCIPLELDDPFLKWTDAAGTTIFSAIQGETVYLEGLPTVTIGSTFSIFESDGILADDPLGSLTGLVNGTSYRVSWIIPEMGNIIGIDEEDEYEVYFEASGASDSFNLIIPRTLPPIECGNTVLDAGEECDDGNTVSGDGCNSVCVSETCTDGIINQDETDVDCGGPNCAACPVSRLYWANYVGIELSPSSLIDFTPPIELTLIITDYTGPESFDVYEKDSLLNPNDDFSVISESILDADSDGNADDLVGIFAITQDVLDASVSDDSDNNFEFYFKINDETSPELKVYPIQLVTCEDNLKNGDETGVDCGGTCPNQDCCTNGYMDSAAPWNEGGVDCDGVCSTLCNPLVKEALWDESGSSAIVNIEDIGTFTLRLLLTNAESGSSQFVIEEKDTWPDADDSITSLSGSLNTGDLSTIWTPTITDLQNANEGDGDYEFSFDIELETSPTFTLTLVGALPTCSDTICNQDEDCMIDYSLEPDCGGVCGGGCSISFCIDPINPVLQCDDYENEIDCNANICGLTLPVPEGENERCSWSGLECDYVYDLVGSDGTITGSCAHDRDEEIDDCEDGFLSYSWSATFTWAEDTAWDNEASCNAECTAACILDQGAWRCDPDNTISRCVGGSDVIACPAQIKLNFFSWQNLIAAIILIIIIYWIIANTKKKPKKRSLPRKKAKKKSKKRK